MHPGASKNIFPGVPWLVIPAKRQLQLFKDFRAALRPHESDEKNNQESVTGENFHSCLPGQVSPGECFACSAASGPLRTQKQLLQVLLSSEQQNYHSLKIKNFEERNPFGRGEILSTESRSLTAEAVTHCH